MLNDIYRVFDTEVANIDFVCRKGCSTCCTQSVTMTTMEGALISAYLEAQGMELPDFPDTSIRVKPSLTTNQFAACFLEGQPPAEEADEPWVFEPCVFLENDCCTIYPVRPFGCRSFGSTVNCGDGGMAETPEWFISLDTVINQFIEHIDRGGSWGNLIDVLQHLQKDGPFFGKRERLLPNQPLPGLLIPPEDLEKIAGLLARLGSILKGEDALKEFICLVLERMKNPGE